MKQPIGWRAYYEDGTRFDSGTHTWKEIPEEGIVGIVVFYFRPYRDVVVSGDFYWRDPETLAFKKSGTSGTWGEWVEDPSPEGVQAKRSGAVRDPDEWADMYSRMMADKEWPPHTPKRTRRRPAGKSSRVRRRR